MANLAFRAEWVGRDELDLRIDRLIGVVQSSEINKALLPGAELIAERWREKIPQPGPDHPYSTGEYYESIKLMEGEEDDFGIASYEVYTDAVNEMSGYPYPVALEFGTSQMAAQPSLRPAIDESEEEVVELAVRALDALVERSLAR